MSERYSKLFSLEENLYTEGSPVIIQAGALQKDNQSGKVLAQLRFKNISDKVIECISVKVTSFDTAGRQLEDIVEYQYLDLHAERDTEFGSKQPIYLSNIKTRAFNVSLTEVVFSDKSIWYDAETEWLSLQSITPVTIREYLNKDYELIEQYEINTGGEIYCVAEKEKDLWICGCGAINHSDEEKCHHCCRTFEELIQSLDVDILKKQADDRLEQKRQEEEERRVEKEKAIADRKEKTKKVGKIIIKSLLLTIIISLITVAGFFAFKFISKNNTYNNALDMVEAKQYNEAIEVFKTLADFRDSEEQIKETNYKKATDFINNNQLDEAMEAFYLLGDYKDSNGTLKGMWYDKAIKLSAEGNYKEAIKYFSLADDYGDSKALLSQNQELAYQEACKMLSENNLTEAAMLFGSAGNYNDAQKQSMVLWDGIAKRRKVTISNEYIININPDGSIGIKETMMEKGRSDDVRNEYWNKYGSAISKWNDIVAIDSNSDGVIGLKRDGEIVGVGDFGKGVMERVSKWENIVDISSKSWGFVGLRSDGTVLFTTTDNFIDQESTKKELFEITKWNSIIDIAAEYCIVGLMSNGGVVATSGYGMPECSDWKDVIAIDVASTNTIALKSNGTVIASSGDNQWGQCNVSNWENIVNIAVGHTWSIGIKENGTIICAGTPQGFLDSFPSWSDMEEVASVKTASWSIAGLKKDGSVVEWGSSL